MRRRPFLRLGGGGLVGVRRGGGKGGKGRGDWEGGVPEVGGGVLVCAEEDCD